MVDVSVIVPCYNYGRFLREAVESVLDQTITPLEVIIVDDGSEDETPEVAERLSHHSSRVRSFRTPNRGPAHARNYGTAKARGTYLAFLDADDRWRPEKLECQLAAMESEPDLAMVFSDCAWFQNENEQVGRHFAFVDGLDSIRTREVAGGEARVIEEDPFLALLHLPILAAIPSATMLRASALGRLRWRSGLHPAEDYEFFIRASRFGEVAFTDRILVEMRRHGNNSYSDRVTPMKSWIRAFRVMLREDGESLSARRRKAVRSKIGRVWAALGWHYYWRNQPVESGAAYVRALAYPGVRRNALKHLVSLPLVPFLPSRESEDESFV